MLGECCFAFSILAYLAAGEIAPVESPKGSYDDDDATVFDDVNDVVVVVVVVEEEEEPVRR